MSDDRSARAPGIDAADADDDAAPNFTLNCKVDLGTKNDVRKNPDKISHTFT